jgi:hypothetical protein
MIIATRVAGLERNRFGSGDGSENRPQAESRNSTNDVPLPCEIRSQLERIVASSMFKDAFRLKSFLRFVVESALAGDANKIKSYTIAIEALGRSSDFDPESNAIVRVEAGRLRRALARYYAEQGGDDLVVIEIPPGTYVPVFSTNPSAADPAADRSAEPDNPEALNAASIDAHPDVTQSAGDISAILRAELRSLRHLIAMQRLQVAAAVAVIERSEHALNESRQLLQLAADNQLACRLDRPLLPVAPPSVAEAQKAADERAEDPKDQAGQAQGKAAARPRRPRPGRDRRDPPDDRAHPRGLRALRV